MFTGLIRDIGVVKSVKNGAMELLSHLSCEPGDSVAVNGACLTVLPSSKGGKLAFDLSDETLRLTNLGDLDNGSEVNLEPALKMGEALGGHLMTGHIDAKGEVLAITELPGRFVRIRVSLPAALKGLVTQKGSIAIDGVSVTVTAAGSDHFETVLIPHTLKKTNLSRRKKGDPINLEADPIARYVRSILENGLR